MKRVFPILIALAVVLVSCADTGNKFKITSCRVSSIVPDGLRSMHATLELGIDNYGPKFELKDVEALVRLYADSCIVFRSDGVLLERQPDMKYSVPVHGTLCDGMNLLTLAQAMRFYQPGSFTVDVNLRVARGGGKGIPVKLKNMPLDKFINSYL